MGDIGKPQRKIILIPEQEPGRKTETAPAPPPQPVQVPEREKVPA